MHLKIRAKYGQKMEVFDESGAPLEGVIAVHIDTDAKDQIPRVALLVHAAVVVDADATVEQSARAPVVEKSARASTAAAAEKPAPR